MSEQEFPFGRFYQVKEVGADFETRVWRKIRRRKNRRRAATASMAFVGLVGVLFLFQVFLAPPPAEKQMIATSQVLSKEEVPLTENLVFAVADAQTLYSLEPISFSPKQKNKHSDI